MKKILALFVLLSCTFAHAAGEGNPTPVTVCKKRDAFVYQTFYWGVIEKSEFGHLNFIYGNGIEDQMTTVYFTSPLTEVSEGKYAFDNGDYQVDVVVKKGKMAFEIRNGDRKSSRKGLVCSKAK